MRKFFLLIAILYASPAFAQTPTVPLNTPFQLVATHDGKNTDGYRCYLDGVKSGADLPASARNATTGDVACPYSGVATAGPHKVGVTAFNATGESQPAEVAFAVTVPLPSKPTNPRILVNGTVVQNGQTVPAQFAFAVKVDPRTKVATLRLESIQ